MEAELSRSVAQREWRWRTDNPGESDGSVLLVGPYPPPLGGVSVYVRSLAEALREHGWRVIVADHFSGGSQDDDLVAAGLKRNPLRYLLVLPRLRADVLHYHHSHFGALIATVASLRLHKRKVSVITLHGEGLVRLLVDRRRALRGLSTMMLRRFDCVIAVNAEIAETVKLALPSADVRVLPAYIPSIEKPEASEVTRAFLSKSGPCLVVSAYKVSFNAGQAKDDYGLDVAVDTFIDLATTEESLRLAVFIANSPASRSEIDYLQALEGRIGSACLENRFAVFIAEPLTPAFHLANCVYLRPTRTEGDSVSVREALDAGAPVIASDIVARPEAVKTVKIGEQRAWSGAVSSAIADDRRESTTGADQARRDSSVQPIIDLYEDLADTKARSGGRS